MIYKLKGTLTSAMFIVLILLIFSLVVMMPVLNMVIIGAIFAYGIRPISRRIDPYIKYKSLSISIAMVIVIIPLIGIIAYSIITLIESAPSMVSIIKGLDFNSTAQMLPYQNYIPESFQSYTDSFLATINLQVADILKGVLEYLINFIQSLPMIALELLIFFASTFYFVRDGDKLWEYVEFTIPHDRKHFFNNLFQEIDRVLKSIFYGHFLTALIIGLMAAIGFWILGYPYSVFLGVITGFFQLIPIIGPWPTYTVLVIYDFVTGNIVRGIVTLLFGFFLSGIDIYIRPKLSGKYADIHPLIFIIGFLSGPLIFGLVGFIIGPLILGVTYAAVIAYKKENEYDLSKSAVDNSKNVD
ncbi:MAG: AI-2E family transporter [Methanobacteriaceae archaeon]|nr:AI-2E family transporter [Methanobacteriaceae archaeon]